MNKFALSFLSTILLAGCATTSERKKCSTIEEESYGVLVMSIGGCSDSGVCGFTGYRYGEFITGVAEYPTAMLVVYKDPNGDGVFRSQCYISK